MANSTAWRPHESSADIHLEQSLLQGSLLVAVAYGAIVILSAQCATMLLRTLRRATRSGSRDSLLLAFVALIFALNTAFMVLVVRLAQAAFIDDRAFPGGPSAYEASSAPRIVVLAGDACLVITTMLADALLVRVVCIGSIMSDQTPHSSGGALSSITVLSLRIGFA